MISDSSLAVSVILAPNTVLTFRFSKTSAPTAVKSPGAFSPQKHLGLTVDKMKLAVQYASNY